MSTNVRELRSWETCRLVELGHLFFNEAALGSEFDEEGMFAHLNQLRSSGKLVAYVLVRDLEIVGCIVGCLGKQMMSKAVLLEELFWYVKPAHRKGVGGIRLLNQFIAHGKKHADGVVMARLHAGQDKLDRYYKELNFKEIESHYLILWPSPPHS